MLRVTWFILFVAVSTASPALNSTDDGLKASCTINSEADVDTVVKNCKTITVGSFAVSAGTTLTLNLQSGTHLTFTGDLAFAYKEWAGPLLWIKGSGITVDGDSNHLIDGRGAKWWDGSGDHSSKQKPQLMFIQATGNSVFKNIKIKNCPHTCIGISDSHDLTIQNWNIDCKDGDTQGGANTDGFDIAKSYKITIKDTTVWNQDDCICINQGQSMVFDNMQCTGGHGLSIAVGLWTDYADNTVYNITFQNSVVQNSKAGIHVKTIPGDMQGEITDVTYKNIKLSGITSWGVNVQQDYSNDGSTGNPKGNIKIKNLVLNNVYGTMSGSNTYAIYVLCGSGGCSNWSWNGVSITGAGKSNSCNFDINGFSC